MARGGAARQRDGGAGGGQGQPRGDRAAGRRALGPAVVHFPRPRGRLARQVVQPPGGDGPARMIAPIRWERDRLLLLDQTLLPVEERTREYSRWSEVADAIRTLVVRGAPAIGCAAAFGIALAARESLAEDTDGLLRDLEEAEKGLAATRPTAVNLFWALDRMREVAHTERALSLPALRA